ncbi:HNH endonuclease family protein [Streptomyces malaysiensis]|uniref:HNH endonuclease family protein n=1 Tax=Streptomyces malaysiensis subsp. samsunensis TaxID=459658 RepID=A0A9X2LZP8_STRMQ|nr:HNH endonuclease family protein [Streptomyces samsunensis]MCQ8833011.1 HNH endonuclease family protein [Streptomyces samsunensis]
MRGSAVVLAALLAVGGCKAGDQDGKAGEKGGGGTSGPAVSGSALSAVASLTVKGRAPKTGYERDEFGSSWVDTDDNGCGTRDDILKRDLKDVKFRDGHCLVASGTLTDEPYTGRDVRFVRGRSKVDIDHVVALSDAWQKGAWKWDRDKRLAFANDPLNLIAVDASANRRKGDGDAATWLPPNTAYRCDYVARQVVVKEVYGLWVTGAEKAAMRRVLGGCPTMKLPARTGGR